MTFDQVPMFQREPDLVSAEPGNKASGGIRIFVFISAGKFFSNVD